MFAESSVADTAKTLASAYRHWEKRPAGAGATLDSKSAPSRALTVAISREAGTHGTDVSEEVGPRLNWQVYDHQLLEVVAKDMGVRAKLLESVDEKHMSWLLEMMERACAVPVVSEPAYVYHLARILLALSAHGECVILGRGAAQILHAPTTLRVRLIAPVQDRIAVVCREHGKSPDEAKRFVYTADREHISFVRNHFQKDPAEPHQYDLILNAARFSVAECAELIVQAVNHLQTSRSKP